jgi:hypothetical protein
MEEAVANSVGLKGMAVAKSRFKRTAELYHAVLCQRLMHLEMEAASVGLDIYPRYHADLFMMMSLSATVQI